jgi:Fungal protein kinase
MNEPQVHTTPQKDHQEPKVTPHRESTSGYQFTKSSEESNTYIKGVRTQLRRELNGLWISAENRRENVGAPDTTDSTAAWRREHFEDDDDDEEIPDDDVDAVPTDPEPHEHLRMYLAYRLRRQHSSRLRTWFPYANLNHSTMSLQEFERELFQLVDSRIRGFSPSLWSQSQERWLGIPQNDDSCYDAFVTLMNAIAEEFSLSDDRKAVRTSAKRIPHQPIGLNPPTPGLVTRPDFSIVGISRSLSPFQTMGVFGDDFESNITYRNIRSVLDLKPVKHITSKAQTYRTAIQLGSYARQQLYEQPNRLFVDALAVSTQYMRLFCFDRTGPSFFDYVDIHTQPVIFVEAILLMFADDPAIGLDTSISYDSDPSPKVSSAVAGTLTLSDWQVVPAIADAGAGPVEVRPQEERSTQSHNPASTATTGNASSLSQAVPGSLTSLKIVGIGLNRSSIVGRGTTCWYVENAVGRELIVKDYWRASTRPSEAKFLLAGVGLSGVGEIYGYQEFVSDELAGGEHIKYNTVSGIRGYNVASMPALKNPKDTTDKPYTLSDRAHCRVITPRYYGDLSSAFNYTCLMVAFRDAVVGEFMWLFLHQGLKSDS